MNTQSNLANINQIIVTNHQEGQEIIFNRYETTKKFFNPIHFNFINEDELSLILQHYKSFGFNVFYFEQDDSVEGKLEASKNTIDYDADFSTLVKNSYLISATDHDNKCAGSFYRVNGKWVYESEKGIKKELPHDQTVMNIIESWAISFKCNFGFYDSKMNII